MKTKKQKILIIAGAIIGACLLGLALIIANHKWEFIPMKYSSLDIKDSFVSIRSMHNPKVKREWTNKEEIQECIAGLNGLEVRKADFIDSFFIDTLFNPETYRSYYNGPMLGGNVDVLVCTREDGTEVRIRVDFSGGAKGARL